MPALKIATLVTALFSLVALSALLILSDLPAFPDWVGPAHFSSSFIIALTLTAFLATWLSNTRLETAWLTLISGCFLVVLLEVFQLINPARNFELEDILMGVAGISAGAILSYYLLQLLGEKVFAPLVIVCAFIMGTYLFYFANKAATAKNLSCGIASETETNWSSVLITDFSHNKGVAVNGGIEFCVAGAEIVARNDVRYSADLRLSLDGLAEAVIKERTFVMGIQFKTTQTQKFSEIISLTWQDTATGYFARLFRRGEHLMAYLQFNGGERTSTSMTNSIVPEMLQELVFVYDGSQQTTWLNGEIAGFEKNFLDLPRKKSTELVLNIGQSSDREWWVPFEGEITSIYLGTKVPTEVEIESIFSTNN